MVESIGISLKNPLINKSLKKKYIYQNKQLFGNEIYLQSLKPSIQDKKVKIEDSWYSQLKKEFDKDYWIQLSDLTRKKYLSRTIFPEPALLFNAFNSTPFENVKVVIIGQDPYHGEGQANGLSFSVNQGIKIPPSLLNIFKELQEDLKIPIPKSGNLQSWANQGVLMLNSVLTVEKDKPNSHKGLGWEVFTEECIKLLSSKLKNVVFILWGKQAQALSDNINSNKHLILSSVHPSPLSAHRGFFGSKPFSAANNYLKEKGIKPINWLIK